MTTPPPVRIDLALFERYLAGDCTRIERSVVQRWLEARPEGRIVVDALRVGAPVAVDVEANLRLVRDRIRRESDSQGRRVSEGAGAGARRAGQPHEGWLGGALSRRGWALVTTGVLAVAVVVAGVSRGVLHGPRRTATGVLTYTTGNGERANITLPDGSTVSLNVASRLEVPVDYAAGNHALRLMGEALFSVPHRDRTPFTVTAGTATARVLGTSFVVRRYPTDRLTTVAVRNGRVAVRSVVVTANQQVQVGATGISRVQPAGAAQFSFATGVLVLDGLRLADAIPELDRWYNADVRLGDATLADQTLTGDVPAGSIGELASLLEWTFNMRVVREGRVLTLYPR